MEWWVAISEIVRNGGLVLVAAIGIFLAWKRVFAANRQAEASTRQAELARRDHVAELFNRAVGQLADDRLEVRLGAIYMLRQIGEDFPDLTRPVFELLQAHLRERLREHGDTEPPIDVQEIAATLKERLEADENNALASKA